MNFRSKLLAIPGATAMTCAAFLIIFNSTYNLLKKGFSDFGPLVFGLILIQIVLLIKLYQLPGFPTSYYFIWPTFLILIIDTPRSTFIESANGAINNFATRFNSQRCKSQKQGFFKLVVFCFILILSSLFKLVCFVN